MIMRKRPLRGEKYILDGEEVTIIKVQNDGKGNSVSVVLPSGKLGSVAKSALRLPTIDTKEYERI